MKTLLFIVLAGLTVDVAMCQIKIPIKPLVEVLIQNNTPRYSVAIIKIPINLNKFTTWKTITTVSILEITDTNITSNYTTDIPKIGPYEQTTFINNQDFTSVPFFDQSTFQSIDLFETKSHHVYDGPILRGAPLPATVHKPGTEAMSEISPAAVPFFNLNETDDETIIPASYLRMAPIQPDNRAMSLSLSSDEANQMNNFSTMSTPKNQIKHRELNNNNTLSGRPSRRKPTSSKPTRKIAQNKMNDNIKSENQRTSAVANGTKEHSNTTTKKYNVVAV